eukprot:2263238-Rhodomonas_salina.2
MYRENVAYSACKSTLSLFQCSLRGAFAVAVQMQPRLRTDKVASITRSPPPQTPLSCPQNHPPARRLPGRGTRGRKGEGQNEGGGEKGRAGQ